LEYADATEDATFAKNVPLAGTVWFLKNPPVAMPSIVFFRSVNVGTHQRFQPGLLAKELAEFDVVNIGAAGTFVARKRVSDAKLREAILGRLPFKPELMICPAGEILDLAQSDPFRGAEAGPDIRQFLTVMSERPAGTHPLPVDRPAGDKWEVRVFKIAGRYALSVLRPQGKVNAYPNAVIEKQFKLSATTRNWNTVESICEILEGMES
jgi:uncharacterized protein (DUF1697 family)